MSKFNIGDEVIDSRTNESGVITDMCTLSSLTREGGLL